MPQFLGWRRQSDGWPLPSVESRARRHDPAFLAYATIAGVGMASCSDPAADAGTSQHLTLPQSGHPTQLQPVAPLQTRNVEMPPQPTRRISPSEADTARTPWSGHGVGGGRGGGRGGAPNHAAHLTGQKLVLNRGPASIFWSGPVVQHIFTGPLVQKHTHLHCTPPLVLHQPSLFSSSCSTVLPT